MHIGPRHHLPVPSQCKGGRPWVKGMRECALAMGRRGKLILGFLLKLLWGEMSCWDDIPPKRSKHELKPLDTYHRGR